MNGLKNNFKNTGKLIKFIFKRERIISAVWLIILTGVTVMVPVVLNSMYKSGPEMQAMAQTMNNPAMIALMGPIYGMENYTIGAMNANEMLLFTVIAAAVMNIFLVIRHTRADEESGRTEVIRSLPTGRLSGIGSVMIFAAVINIALSLLTGLGLYAAGIESMDFSGSMLYGFVLGASGMFFAAVTALFAQLSSIARGTAAFSFIFLGICYMVRAVGDINNETLSRISPLGLILRTQVYVKNFWWPVLIILLFAVLITGVSFYLSAVRDIGQGLIPGRSGKKNASKMLQSPFGLAFRLLRNTLIAWAVAMLVFGAIYGSVMGDLETFIKGNEMLMQILPANPEDSVTELFITLLMAIIAMTAAVPVLISILKLRSEEKRNYTEHILTRGISRTKFIMSYFLISVAASFVMLFAGVFGLWAASAVSMEVPIAFSSMLKYMMIYLPAVWFMIGLAMLLIGAFPKLTNLSLMYVGVSFFVVYFGRALQFPDWVRKLSPFGYIPQLPVDKINYITLAVLTAISMILTAAGFLFYKRRDMQG